MAYAIANPVTGQNIRVEGDLAAALATYKQAMADYLAHQASLFSIVEIVPAPDGEMWKRIEPETGVDLAEVTKGAIRLRYEKLMSGEDTESFGATAIRQVLSEDGVLP